MGGTWIDIGADGYSGYLAVPASGSGSGILLFQDLAVVPLLILIPSLAKNPDDLAETLAWAAGKPPLTPVPETPWRGGRA